MRIEKLNENKIRIFLDLKDLREKNIDLHTFMSNSVESQDLFLDMLSQAEAEVGFITKNYKLIIEALASSNGNFILTVTRIKPDSSTNKSRAKKPIAKRKTIAPNKKVSIYAFNSFDNFCDFCHFVNASSLQQYLPKLKNISLFYFKNKYYLVINGLNLNATILKSFYCLLSEFASAVSNEILFERKLKEYGSIIINKSAISTCLKYFV